MAKRTNTRTRDEEAPIRLPRKPREKVVIDPVEYDEVDVDDDRDADLDIDVAPPQDASFENTPRAVKATPRKPREKKAPAPIVDETPVEAVEEVATTEAVVEEVPVEAVVEEVLVEAVTEEVPVEALPEPSILEEAKAAEAEYAAELKSAARQMVGALSASAAEKRTEMEGLRAEVDDARITLRLHNERVALAARLGLTLPSEQAAFKVALLEAFVEESEPAIAAAEAAVKALIVQRESLIKELVNAGVFDPAPAPTTHAPDPVTTTSEDKPRNGVHNSPHIGSNKNNSGKTPAALLLEHIDHGKWQQAKDLVRKGKVTIADLDKLPRAKWGEKTLDGRGQLKHLLFGVQRASSLDIEFAIDTISETLGIKKA